MVNFGLITWDYCKAHLELDTRDKELTELLIFSASAEIEIYTDRNLFELEIRELYQYPVKELNYTDRRLQLSKRTKRNQDNLQNRSKNDIKGFNRITHILC